MTQDNDHVTDDSRPPIVIKAGGVKVYGNSLVRDTRGLSAIPADDLVMMAWGVSRKTARHWLGWD